MYFVYMIIGHFTSCFYKLSRIFSVTKWLLNQPEISNFEDSKVYRVMEKLFEQPKLYKFIQE